MVCFRAGADCAASQVLQWVFAVLRMPCQEILKQDAIDQSKHKFPSVAVAAQSLNCSGFLLLQGGGKGHCAFLSLSLSLSVCVNLCLQRVSEKFHFAGDEGPLACLI